MVPGPGGAPAPSTPSSVLNNTAPAPGVRLRITTSTGEDISGTKLGEKLFLRIEIDRASIYGIFAKNLRAISPADSDEIELLDGRGCPTDPVIFPGLEKVPGSEDLQSSFEAFKFSDTSVAKFQVNVAFCLGGCNPSTAATASCPTAYGDARPRLARSSESRVSRRDTEARLQYSAELGQEVLVSSTPLSKEIFVEMGTKVDTMQEGGGPLLFSRDSSAGEGDNNIIV